MKRLLFLLFLALCSWSVQAQQDSVMLMEIQVNAPKILKYSAGAKTGSAQISSGSLTNIESKRPSIYFKGYNDQLATIAFRGTSASHTAVFWNEVPINSPTLGQTDFSFWPGYLFENITVQYGGAAAQFGSGAIGGALHLGTIQEAIDSDFKANGLLKVGSFGRLETGVGFKYSKGVFLSETKIYRKTLTNDFEYDYRGERHTQENAAVSQFALAQKLGVALGNFSTLGLDVIYAYTDRENQPIKGSSVFTQLDNKNLASTLSFILGMPKYQFKSVLGFVMHDLNYNLESRTKTLQYSWRNEVDLDFSYYSSLKIGTVWNRYKPESSNFESGATDDQIDFYLGYNLRLLKHWNISINLREVWYNGNLSPLSPSIGQMFDLQLSERSKLEIGTSISRSFRIPTLNDRFWQPGGNPELKNEIGWNAEAGIAYQYKTDDIDLKFSIDHFRNWVKDWIYWLPTNEGYWAPVNAREVHISGLEFGLNYLFKIGNNKILVNSGYSYTESLNQNSDNQAEQGNQMPYVPIHNGFMKLEWQHKTWRVNQYNTFTGLRYTSLDNSDFNSVDKFWLADLEIAKDWPIGELTLTAAGGVNNFLNKSYENIKNYAMPGINYSIELHINY